MIGLDTSFLIGAELEESTLHDRAWAPLQRCRDRGDRLLLTSEVLSEFLHVTTDARRFTAPLTMEDAIRRAREQLDAPETSFVVSSEASTRLAIDWMTQHRLGRKRVTDTQLAATFWTRGVRRILTLNGRDFTLFAPFEIVDF